MAACSSGVARPAVSSITETRYSIPDHPLRPGAPPAGGRSPLPRTPLPRSDTASPISFQDFLLRRLRTMTAAPMSRASIGGCVLRAASRPISLDGYAPGSGPRVDQLERGVRTGIGEQPCALADDDGIGEQLELVDQVVGEQPSDEGTAAGHQQFAVLLRLQITDPRSDVAGQDTRARPL